MPVMTIPGLFEYIERCNIRPDLLNYHTSGNWVPISTKKFISDVRQIAAGLLSLGSGAGANIGIISNSTPSWVTADFGIQLTGGIT
ncbi:MAG: AMP-binding protein, partial [Spirochaetia bacterium]